MAPQWPYSGHPVAPTVAPSVAPSILWGFYTIDKNKKYINKLICFLFIMNVVNLPQNTGGH